MTRHDDDDGTPCMLLIDIHYCYNTNTNNNK